MTYDQTVTLKGGTKLLIRAATAENAAEVLAHDNATHAESEFLLTYPEENGFTLDAERDFLERMEISDREVELMAIIGGKLVGTAGLLEIGNYIKTRHRASLGIAVLKAYSGMGIGTALIRACFECARAAGYRQMELEVVAENDRAIALYERMGFEEYGRNPMGFITKDGREQAAVMMRAEIEGLLDVNRDFCKKRMAEKASQMLPPND